jgi:hypothetical protein
MAEPDWTALNDINFDTAARVLVEQGNAVMTFMIHSSDGIAIVGVPDFDDAARDRLPMLLRLLCIAHDAIAVGHVTEAYAARMHRQEGESEAAFRTRCEAVRPSERPERIEVLIATMQWRTPTGLRQATKVGEVTRNARAEPVAVVAREEDSQADSLTQSLWLDLLAPTAASENDRAMAQIALEMLVPRLGFDLRFVDPDWMDSPHAPGHA